MELSDELLALASRHEEDLDALFWASEKDRWTELIFCIFNAFMEDPELSRQLIDVLEGAGLVEPAVLAQTSDPTKDCASALRYILTQYGFDEDGTHRAIGVLSRIGTAIQSHHQGKIQRYLRRQGERMRGELLGMFGDASETEPELRQAVTHWLQNAAGIPISVYDPTVQRFCDKHGIGLQELEAAADDIDFNLALVDDVIRADSQQPSETGVSK